MKNPRFFSAAALALLVSLSACNTETANSDVDQVVTNDTLLNSADPSNGRVQTPGTENEQQTPADNKVPTPTDSVTRPVNSGGQGVQPNRNGTNVSVGPNGVRVDENGRNTVDINARGVKVDANGRRTNTSVRISDSGVNVNRRNP